jgi:hypothetical protein
MKKLRLLLLLSVTALLSSCYHLHLQVFETKPTSEKIAQNGESYVFDNDSVRITYSFWGDMGVLSYTLENKLNRPIYIDWKSSSFINNGKKIDYWEDQVITNTVTTGRSDGVSYRIPFTYQQLTAYSGQSESISNTVTQKPEKTSFIPPHSRIDKNLFLIYPYSYYNLTCQTAIPEIVPRSDKARKKTTVYGVVYETQNTPITFRNYITYTFSEGSTPLYSIDNGFYVSSIKEMRKKHFLGKKKPGFVDGNRTFQEPFKKESNFYIEIFDPANNIERRSKGCK